MTPTLAPAEIDRSHPVSSESAASVGEARDFLRRALLFAGIGLILYLGLYAGAESLVHRHTVRNRFYAIQHAPHTRYDFVILGASHAAVLDYREMNSRLEQRVGGTVLNLATVGGGISVNRFLLDYFFRTREAGTVVYLLDSFAFYSPLWNEERLQDRELYRRAAFDPALFFALLRMPGSRGTALDHLFGFSKINDPNRFRPDLFEAETSRFDRVYRPIPQLDRQRLEYLYPGEIGPEVLSASPYLRDFEALLSEVLARGVRMLVVRPPIPDRIRERIPGEDAFEALISERVRALGAEYLDLSAVANEPEFFYDSDHLNRAGVERFIDEQLGEALARFPAAARTGTD